MAAHRMTPARRAALKKAQLASARKRKGKGRGRAMKKRSGRGSYARWVDGSFKKGGSKGRAAVAALTFSPLGYGVSKFRGRKRK